MSSIEKIADIIAVIARDGKVSAESWPSQQSLTPRDLGLQSIDGDLCWPDSLVLLDQESIAQALPELTPRIFPIIGSTNSTLLEQGSTGSIANRLYLAEFQYDGRGRRGRRWLSPYGRNLSMSLGAATNRTLPELGGLSLVVGLALADALEKLGVGDLKLKWPNDILVGDQKLCGILLELVQRDSAVEFVAGMGVNVSLTPEEVNEIGQPVTDLRRCGVTASRSDLVIQLISQVRIYLQHFEQAGFAPFVQAFNILHKFQGQTCSITQGNNTIIGTVAGVGLQGELVLLTDAGEQRFFGGEVSLRPSI